MGQPPHHCAWPKAWAAETSGCSPPPPSPLNTVCFFLSSLNQAINTAIRLGQHRGSALRSLRSMARAVPHCCAPRAKPQEAQRAQQPPTTTQNQAPHYLPPPCCPHRGFLG